jgi:hypothetical protein
MVNTMIRAEQGTDTPITIQTRGSSIRSYLSIMRLRVRVLLGTIYEWAGVPGLVRDCDYEAGAVDARIKVRAHKLFTVVTVNGLDIYFHRLTGSIDGVGTSQPYRCKPD